MSVPCFQPFYAADPGYANALLVVIGKCRRPARWLVGTEAARVIVGQVFRDRYVSATGQWAPVCAQHLTAAVPGRIRAAERDAGHIERGVFEAWEIAA